MSTSGDRHLRPEPSGKLKGLITGPRTVLVRATLPYAGTFAGQVLLQLLVNLLCRQFGVIDKVWLDIPPTPVDQRAFPFPILPLQEQLTEQLLALGRAVGGKEIPIELIDHGKLPSAVAIIGSDVEPISEGSFSVAACGDGWDAFCSPSAKTPQVSGTSEVPFGPFLSACLVAGAIFRHFHQIPPAPTASLCLWDFDEATWHDTCTGMPLAGLRLPSAHLIGLGAVGAAFALALAVTPGISGSLIGLDPQKTDTTGRNRLLSAFYEEIGWSKALLTARLFDGSGMRFYANESRWPDYATDPRRYVPPDIRSEEEQFRYAWVISCVDRNIHRQNIARFLPRNVLSGSTDGLVAQATYFAMEGPRECLACNHPIPHFSLEERVQELQGLSPADRQARYENWGLAPAVQAAIDEYLYNPTCGQAAEAELRRLGVDGTTDWSVGFVSAAAGVMLAAYFTRCALEGVESSAAGHSERRLIFLSLQEFLQSSARRKPNCDVCGDKGRQAKFRQRWGICSDLADSW